MSTELTLPNSLVIGPQKAGTSWIARYFEARNDIALPQGVKETFYFDRRFRTKPVQWYASHFAYRNAQHNLTIEVAPTYFHDPEVPQRVLDTLGRIPLVCTLRQPVRRTWSLYLHMKRYGFTKQSLRDAAKAHPELLDSSRYAECLQRWFDVFGRDSMLVLEQEQLAASSDNLVRILCNHLNLPFVDIPESLRVKVNEASAPRHYLVAATGRIVGDALRNYRLYPVVEFAKRLGMKSLFFGKPYGQAQPKMTVEEEDWLNEQLAGETEALEKLLNRSFSHWHVHGPNGSDNKGRNNTEIAAAHVN